MPRKMQSEEKEDKAMQDQRKGIDEREEEMEIDLGLLFAGMWKNIRRFWWLALLLIATGAAGVLVYQRVFHQRLYECSATFTVATGNDESGSYSFYYDSSTADQMSLTFPYILESSFFQSALLEELGTDTLNGTVTSETITDSNVVTMRVESPDAEDARAILEAALTIYPETARFVLGDIQFNMLDEPVTPTEPFNQMSVQRSLLLGGAGGAAVSALIFMLMSLFWKSVCSPDDMKKITSLRCMAVFPHVRFKARKKNDDTRLSLMNEKLPFGYKESMRALQKRIVKGLEQLDGKILMVTSSVAGEGKSTVAVNLAQMLAADGYSVLLIDGDLRKPGDAALLGVRGKYGLQDVAKADPHKTEEMLVKINKDRGCMLGNSKPVKQPASVLSSRRVKLFIREMRRKMDYVIIDSPPCTMFQDAGILADYADGILYVVKYDDVPRQKIQEGISFLGGQKAPFIGYVFNNFPEGPSEYGYGRYGYGKYGYGKYGYGKYGRGRYGYGGYGYEKEGEGQED